jgi:hypothetical protein
VPEGSPRLGTLAGPSLTERKPWAGGRCANAQGRQRGGKGGRRNAIELAKGRPTPTKLALLYKVPGAADLAFLHRLQPTRSGTPNRKAALESWSCWCPSFRGTSVPLPTLVSLCREPFYKRRTSRRKQKGHWQNYGSGVALDLTFLRRIRGNAGRNVKSATLVGG